MPLFEMEASPRGRMRVFGRTQLPFALGAVLIAVVAALVDPSLLGRGPMLT